MIQVKELVVTDLSRRGSGCDETSPVRSVLEIYTKEGELLAVHDIYGNYTVEQLITFARLCRAKSDVEIKKVYQLWSKV